MCNNFGRFKVGLHVIQHKHNVKRVVNDQMGAQANCLSVVGQATGGHLSQPAQL